MISGTRVRMETTGPPEGTKVPELERGRQHFVARRNKSHFVSLIQTGGRSKNKPMDWIFFVTLFVVAFLYSSVGHGGGSGYLAIMALWAFSPLVMKTSALTLNLFVSSVAFYNFYRAGYFRWKILLPFILTSVPLAWMGAAIHVQPRVYKIILGIFLFIATLRMIIQTNTPEGETRPLPFYIGLITGAFLGFFSGLIGIGGGIILSPLLILMRWSTVKEAAAISAAFIFLNSASGLTSTIFSTTGASWAEHIAVMIFITILGGLLGSYSGSFRISGPKLKYMLAGVLFIASFKLFLY